MSEPLGTVQRDAGNHTDDANNRLEETHEGWG